ncbi:MULTISPECIES: hypothetical protein [Culturomica]|jgi:hypothetical protein|uniref:hypothetical protein n=1 Tax=Culturomica TaxID=1926651 RepID=UPI00083867D6|nr:MULTISPECIES: hypothetical protein [Culturomica]HBO27261.1 hypothetical protein [Culturomica sp.]
MKIIAQGISYLFHPLLIPLYGLFLIFNSNSVFSLIPEKVRLYCYGMTFITLFLVPLLSMLVFKKFKLITSFDLELKQERIYPVLVTIFSAFLGFYLIGMVPYTNIVQQLYLVLIIMLSAFSIITMRWKISMHMTAAGAVCGFVSVLGLKYLGDVRPLLMLTLFVSGALATCRLYLKKHNPAQIYAGFFFGLVFVVCILY